MTTDQRTLSGGTADPDALAERTDAHTCTTDRERPRPRTLLWCPTCGDWLLRRARYDHPHALVDATSPDKAAKILDRALDNDLDLEPGMVLAVGKRSEHPSATVVHDPDDELDTGGDPTDDSPTAVGKYYTIELNYSVKYRYRVPAHTKHEAKDRAELVQLDDSRGPADRELVHTRTREGDVIFDTDAAAKYVAGEHNDFDPEPYDP